MTGTSLSSDEPMIVTSCWAGDILNGKISVSGVFAGSSKEAVSAPYFNKSHKHDCSEAPYHRAERPGGLESRASHASHGELAADSSGGPSSPKHSIMIGSCAAESLARQSQKA